MYGSSDTSILFVFSIKDAIFEQMALVGLEFQNLQLIQDPERYFLKYLILGVVIFATGIIIII